jgi:NitT/TauT family transport system substrate-binding protein
MKRILAVVLCLCAQPAFAQTPKSIVFATSDPAMSVSSAPYTSLQETLGLVKREAGVDMTVQATAGATAAAQAVSSGNAFYNWGGMSSLIVAAQQDPNLVIISFERNNSFRIVVPASSPIATVADLKGKMIGSQSFGSAAYLFGRAVIAAGGLDPDRDVHWLPIGVGAQAASALRGNMVAAYAGYDSPDAVISILLHEDLRELPSPLNDLPGMSGIIVRRDSVEKYPQIVAGVCRAFYTALVFAAANPVQTVLNHWRVFPDQRPSNIPPAEAQANAVTMLTKRLDPLAHPGADGLFGYQTMATMQHTADELFKAGLVKVRPEMEKLSDQRFKEQCGRLDVPAITTQAISWKAP